MKIPLFVKSLLLSVPVGVTFFDCVGYVARVEGISMQPALNPDGGPVTDYVFLSRWAVRNMEVERGDVISLISPKDPGQKIIKRVVGLQGDVISTLGYKQQFVKVPEGHCWVEGDHTGLLEGREGCPIDPDWVLCLQETHWTATPLVRSHWVSSRPGPRRWCGRRLAGNRSSLKCPKRDTPSRKPKSPVRRHHPV